MAWPRIATFGSSLVLLFLIFLGPWSQWTDTAWDAFVRISARHGFVIDDVLIEGRCNVDAEDVRNAIRLRRGDPILLDTPAAIRQRLENLSWVKEAAVQRVLLNLIYVRLTERQPVAIWQNKGKFFLIDVNGKIIDSEKAGLFRGLPLVVGLGAATHAKGLFDALAQFPRIQEVVTAAVRVSDRRWDLKLKNGMRIQLPEQNYLSVLAELDHLMKKGLLQKEVTVVDLRLPDRWVLTVPPSLAIGMRYQEKTKMKKV
jgi:cell division protein FtsQ